MPPELDLMQVLKKAVRDSGVTIPVCLTPPNAQKFPECVVLSFGAPRATQSYYDFSTDIPLRISVICKCISEFDAMQDALKIKEFITYGSLDSYNGSYEVADLTTTQPRPLPWDESGRFVWVFDIEMSIERIY